MNPADFLAAIEEYFNGDAPADDMDFAVSLEHSHQALHWAVDVFNRNEDYLKRHVIQCQQCQEEFVNIRDSAGRVEPNGQTVMSNYLWAKAAVHVFVFGVAAGRFVERQEQEKFAQLFPHE